MFSSLSIPSRILLASTATVPFIYFYATLPKQMSCALDKDSFVPFKLSSIQKINHNTSKFTFELPNNTLLGLPVASCLVTKALIDVESSPGSFDLIIKRYNGGKMSTHIHALKTGDVLEMKGPIEKWAYPGRNVVGHLGMIAGGTGITPMLQIIRKVLSDPKDKTKISLLFGNVTEEDILLREYLDTISKSHPDQVKVYHMLSDAPKGWTQGKGYVNESVIKQFMPKPKEGKVFVCGPPPLVASICGPKNEDKSQGAVEGVLKAMGYGSEDVFKF